MNGRLLYHQLKCKGIRQGVVKTTIERDGTNLSAYSDDFSGNQDPYIWQKVFLHTYCHMGQIRNPEEGDIHFWITSKKGDYAKLYCDLVFVIAKKADWTTPDRIDLNDSLVESDTAFQEHYVWAERGQHPLEKRFTLKADPCKSFQPQDADGNLCDIRLFLEDLLDEVGITALEKALGPKRQGPSTHPFLLNEQQALDLYAKILAEAHFCRTGTYFAHPAFQLKRKPRKRRQMPKECS